MMEDISYVKTVDFSIYTQEKKEKICVKNITKNSTINELGIAINDGLSDLSMGASDVKEICITCSLNGYECSGHLGNIQFALPLYNPMFFDILLQLLKGTCFVCHQPYAAEYKIVKFVKQIQLLRYGLIQEAILLDQYFNRWLSKMQHKSKLRTLLHRNLIRKILKFYQKSILKHHRFTTPRQTTKSILDHIHTLRASFIKNIFHDISSKKCSRCSMPKSRVRHEFHSLICLKFLKIRSRQKEDIDLNLLNESSVKLDPNSMKSVYPLTTHDVIDHFKKFTSNQPQLLSALFGRTHEEENILHLFFINSICVVPPKFRPISVLGENKFENPLTSTYKKIITNGELLEHTLKEMCDGNTSQINIRGIKKNDLRRIFSTASNKFEKLQAVWSGLQSSINILYDKTKSKNLKEECVGIRQVLEKKEGLFRMHMMGKRVNYAARSVISPDPMLDIDQVGIPGCFATKLTFPEIFNPLNSQNLINCLSNGPHKHPGASQVMIGESRFILHPSNSNRNKSVSKRITTEDNGSKIIQIRRHLMNNDHVLMNRQPSLHRPSIMAHRVRVLPEGHTIKLHYANCKSYNADFDGDEMNAHFPQSYLSQAEASHIAACSYQYLSPRDGKPLTGLIQDYMIAGVLLSVRDRFLDCEHYQKIVFSSLVNTNFPVRTLPPTIYKPHKLWTGKQVISTLIINCTPQDQHLLNMRGKSKITESLWQTRDLIKDMTDDNILIRDGELLIGIFDKNQFGATSYGLIHYFYELYGGQASTRLLSVLGRACISLLKYTGFTMGVEDIVVEKSAISARNHLIEESKTCNALIFNKVFGSSDYLVSTEAYKYAHQSRKLNILSNVESIAKSLASEYQNKITRVCSANSLVMKFPSNSLQIMIQSGSKGSIVNAMQISALLGQIELEGKRPPLMVSGRTLPCFKAYDCSLQSGGFVESSFLTGLKGFEYFFHCMAGREGLIDTAVKTSRIGYLQRCLIKHLEGVKTAYDHSARDSDGSLIQFLYGEDGCETQLLQFSDDRKFEIFSLNHEQLRSIIHPDLVLKTVDCQTAEQETEKSYSNSVIVERDNQSFVAKNPHIPLPSINIYSPSHYLGSVSDKYRKLTQEFIRAESGKSIVSSRYTLSNWQCSRKEFELLMKIKYLKSLSTPGESVGLVSAQSIGEPSTQMTLNTFHFAGRGDVNVTLGIPRLRELFMVGSENIKTPSVRINIWPDSRCLDAAKKLAMKLSPTPLENFVRYVEIHSNFKRVHQRRSVVKQEFSLFFYFVDPSEMEQYQINFEYLSHFFEHTFHKKFMIEVTKRLRRNPKVSVTRGVDILKDKETGSEHDDESSDTDSHSGLDETQTDSHTILDKNIPSFSTNSCVSNKENNYFMFSFDHDVSSQRSSFILILKKLLHKIQLNQTQDIRRCIIIEEDNIHKIHAEGNNLIEFWAHHDIFDLRSLYSNNIHKMAECYGIEAARNVLVCEIKNVFQVYGITVNNRHLTLLADYMTYHGNYRPCNRYGLQSNSSPFQKMSFETTSKFLKDACTYYELDTLDAPSSRIVLGLPIKNGTGSFKILSSDM